MYSEYGEPLRIMQVNSINKTTDINDNHSQRISTKDWATMIFLSIIWGSSFILIKKSLIAFDFIEMGTLRLAISFLAFIPIYLTISHKVDWSQWKAYILIGVTGSGLPSYFFALAQTKISSGASGVLNSLSPIFTLLLGVLFFGAVFQWNKILGVILGLLGAAILILLGEQAGIGSEPLYALFVVCGTICYAFNTNYVKSFFTNTDPLPLSAASFITIGSPALLYILLISDVPHKVMTHPNGLLSLGAVSILSLVGTVFSIIIYYRLIDRTHPIFASSIAYLIPVVSIIWGYLDGEPFSYLHVLGLGLILGGVYVISKTSNS